jgi:hypothetical protein
VLLMVSPRAVPGAGDNLVASAMLVSVAGLLKERLAAEPGLLDGTRVIFASFDAEESGLRGSRAFVRHNRALLTSAPASDVDLESFYHLDSLGALVTDLNGFVKLSDGLAAMLEEEAKALGVPFCRRKVFYGIGATDAAEFARAGIPATCLVGMSRARGTRSRCPTTRARTCPRTSSRRWWRRASSCRCGWSCGWRAEARERRPRRRPVPSRKREARGAPPAWAASRAAP